MSRDCIDYSVGLSSAVKSLLPDQLKKSVQKEIDRGKPKNVYITEDMNRHCQEAIKKIKSV